MAQTHRPMLHIDVSQVSDISIQSMPSEISEPDGHTPRVDHSEEDSADHPKPIRRIKTMDRLRRALAAQDAEYTDDSHVSSRVTSTGSHTSQTSPRLNIGKSMLSPRNSVVQRNLSKQFRTPKHLVYWKRTVLVFILLATAIMGWLAYRFANNFEIDQFKESSDATTELLLKRISIQLQNFIDTPGMLGSLYGLTVEETMWPNATLSAFTETSQYTVNVSNVEFIYFCPLVAAEEQRVWESYAEDNYHRLQGDQDIYSGATGSWGVAKGIYKYDSAGNQVYDNSSDIFAPVWQISPIDNSPIESFLSSAVMFNLYSYNVTKPIFDKVIDGQPYALTNLIHESASNDIFQHNLAPIYAGGNASNELVGFFSAYASWTTMLKDLIQTNRGSMYLVLSMGPDVVTFRVYGDRAEFVGFGDLHDSKFDTLGREMSVNVGMDGTTMVFVAYPSSEYLDLFTTSLPINACIVVVTVMIFTVLVFIIYDAIVTRHEEFLAETAETNSTVVQQLFPQFVREKLTERAKLQSQQEMKEKKSRSQSRRGRGRTASYDNSLIEQKNEGILAKKFEKATVLFADLAGFTKWSSGRDAELVFDLLETLFARFDFYARKRGVFKVETIGDCYMAVTGVPDETDKHAEIMAEFALDMLRGFDKVVAQKKEEGKADVGDLQLRVGFHSGPVIGGVVRGDKGRFQLFGDTVNTASRMESTGVPGKIQCSASSWRNIVDASIDKILLVERSPKIEAKGKGTMTTYFVTDASKTTVVSSPPASTEGTPRYLPASSQFATGTLFPALSPDPSFTNRNMQSPPLQSCYSSRSPSPQASPAGIGKGKKRVSWISSSDDISIGDDKNVTNVTNVTKVCDITGKLMMSLSNESESAEIHAEASKSARTLTKCHSEYDPAIHDTFRQRPITNRKWDFLRSNKSEYDNNESFSMMMDEFTNMYPVRSSRSSSESSGKSYGYGRYRSGTTATSYDDFTGDDKDDDENEVDENEEVKNSGDHVIDVGVISMDISDDV